MRFFIHRGNMFGIDDAVEWCLVHAFCSNFDIEACVAIGRYDRIEETRAYECSFIEA